jgi:hypothetical protein
MCLGVGVCGMLIIIDNHHCHHFGLSSFSLMKSVC